MKLAEWRNEDEVAERLALAGMRSDCAQRAARSFIESTAELKSLGVDENTDVMACWAPGRIEVFGKHTDYCGGESILAAAERGFCMLAAATADPMIRLVDARRHDLSEFAIQDGLQPRVGHWSNYPQTAAQRLARNFPQARNGATIAFSSNLPPSSGMSSSSAFVVGTFLLLADINGVQHDSEYARLIRTREDLAGYLSTVENGMSFGALAGDKGVGTFGGSEDHAAILCGQAERLVQYAFCPVRFQRSIAVADQYVFAIASSGVIAEKTGTAMEKYNRLSAMASTIVDIWRCATKGVEASLAAILDSAPGAAERLRNILSATSGTTYPASALVERLDHFVMESELIRSIPNTVGPLMIDEFGKLALRSHDAAVSLLKNQTPETIQLAAVALELGAHGASAFGAGFGGSVWALVDSNGASAFLDGWQERYCSEFPETAERSEFFLMRPGPPAITWGA